MSDNMFLKMSTIFFKKKKKKYLTFKNCLCILLLLKVFLYEV